MGDWQQIAPLFEQLENGPLDGIEQLEKWIGDASELAACLSEERCRRYVDMTCQTNDKEKAYLLLCRMFDMSEVMKNLIHSAKCP